MGEAVIDDDFGFGSTDTGNVSHVVPTIHPHIKIGSRNLVGHTSFSRGGRKCPWRSSFNKRC